MKIFRERLKEAREECGLNIMQLAKKAEMSHANISMWESGRRTPNIEGLQKLCRALNVSSDFLLGLKDSMD